VKTNTGNDDGNKFIEKKSARNGVRIKAAKYIVSSESKVLTFAREFAGYILYWN